MASSVDRLIIALYPRVVASPQQSMGPQALAKFLSTVAASDKRTMLANVLTVYNEPMPEELIEEVEQLVISEQSAAVQWENLEYSCRAGNVGVWRGDITTLEIDGIVNAANSRMLGCFTPGHKCIDNIIHAKAGPRLRMECRDIMHAQGHEEPTGICKITKGYCLPCKHVLHTVGPICEDHVPRPRELASCYTSILDTAVAHGLRSVAFCCISTGVFGYPGEPAAQVALQTVATWLAQPANAGKMDMVLFNVFTPKDHDIYKREFPKVFGTAPAAASAATAADAASQ